MNRTFGKMTAAAMLLLVVAGMMFLMGCSEKEDGPADDPYYDPVPKNTETYYGEDLERQAANDPDFAGVPSAYKGVNGEYQGYLGWSYNVLQGQYFKSSGIKSKVLNTNKLVAEGKIYEDDATAGEARPIVGSDITSYSEALKTHIGAETKGLFSGSLEADFGSSTKWTATKSFGKISVELRKKTHYINALNVDNIRKDYLDADFKNNILLNNSITPVTLLSQYGTHVMIKVTDGGRIDMGYLIDNTSKESETSISTKLKASYGTVKGDASVDYNTTRSWVTSKTEEYVHTEGGSLATNMTSFENAKNNYSSWAASINAGTQLALIDGGKVSEMIPIWDLVDPATHNERRNAIKAEYDKQKDANEASIATLQQTELIYYVKNLYLGNGSSWDKAEASLKSETSEALNIIWRDLNNNSGGDYILLGYTRTTSPDSAITGTFIWDRQVIGSYPGNSTVQNGNTFYKVRDLDLNKGASGDDLWLFQTKGKANGLTPIINLFIAINHKTGDMKGTGWSQEGWDMNKKAGGDDVHLWVQRRL